jgi:hypothetical protein
MIVPGGGEHLIAAAQHVLPHDLCRDVRIARLGEVAVCGATNEAAFALRIKPPRGFTIRNGRGDWCARCLLCSAAATTTAASSSSSSSSSAWSALRALPAASALIAAASSVVAVVAALTRMPLIAIALLLAASISAAPFSATTGLAAARCLRIVRSLLLLRGSA